MTLIISYLHHGRLGNVHVIWEQGRREWQEAKEENHKQLFHHRRDRLVMSYKMMMMLLLDLCPDVVFCDHPFEFLREGGKRATITKKKQKNLRCGFHLNVTTDTSWASPIFVL